MNQIKKIKVDQEFLNIAKEIIAENLSLTEWEYNESSDQFQTENFCGGFDGIEMEFTFSYYGVENEEYWFQLSLDDINSINNLEKTEIEMKLADKL